MTKVKDIIKQLKKFDQDSYIKVASDEEWNTIYCDMEIEKNGKHGAYIIFGLSGSEVESYEDVASQEEKDK